MSNTTTKIINNCEFRWAKLTSPVDPFGAGKAYELQIITDDVMVAEDWFNESLNVKTKEEDGKTIYYVNLKRWDSSPKTGKKYGAPIVVGREKEKIDGSIVGNGSKGKVKIYQYDYNNAGKSGTTSQLVAVQVTDLVEYKKDEIIDF